jgi:hypothetical protein
MPANSAGDVERSLRFDAVFVQQSQEVRHVIVSPVHAPV